MTGKYYAMVNRLRQRGVWYFEFSLTECHWESRELSDKGLCLLVHFNSRAGSEDSASPRIKDLFENSPARLSYASREVSQLSIFRTLEPSDPNPARYQETAIFTIPEVEPIQGFLEDDVLKNLLAATGELSLQVYRPLGTLESMPWSRRTFRT